MRNSTLPGTIAFCSREDHIDPAFTASLARLMAAMPDTHLVHKVGSNIAASRNAAVHAAQGDWIWFIDTDMVFAPDIVTRLLAHEVDVVQALTLAKHPPHEPILWATTLEQRDAFVPRDPKLLGVLSVGAGGTLYRRSCFERVPHPWFEGELGREDTSFAAKLVAAGIELYVDLTTHCGHITPMIVWPHYEAGTWAVRYQAVNGQSAIVDASAIGVLTA